MPSKSVATAVTTACLVAMSLVAPAAAGDLTVVTSAGPLPNIMNALMPLFERASGHKVTLGSKAGPAIADDLKQGAVDLVITNADTVDGFVKSGDVTANSRTMVMISKIGIAVPTGAKKPNVSTADALKATLLAAKSVSYSQQASGQLFVTVLDGLGILDAVKAKVVHPQQGENVGAVLARGGAEIGFQQVAELLPVKGIDFIGELPANLQKRIPYAAGIASKTKEPAAARALLEFLRSEASAAVLRQKGMDVP